MKKLIPIISLLCINLINSFGQASPWRVTSTSTTFVIKMLGVSINGKLSGFEGSVNFDSQNLAESKIVGSVKAATIDTDNSLRNKHIKEKSDFFEVEKYPKISMESTTIEKKGQAYVGTFNLKIKNITKSIQIPFTVSMVQNTAKFVGSVTINRKDWKLGGNTLGMSQDVLLQFTLNTQK